VSAPAAVREPAWSPPHAAIGVGVLGATGYGGAELVRLLTTHPGAALLALGSRHQAGKPMARVWPSLPDLDLVLDDDPDDPGAWIDRGVAVVFSALPHGAFLARAAAFLDAGLRVVDLSSDFRLSTAEGVTYGLTEWCGTELDRARLVANPGCYATAVLLAILPAVTAGWWSGSPIIANALSGVSGAGRSPGLTTHFVECGNSAAPYRVGDEHAHLREIARALARVGQEGPVVFNPHLVPMARGILATVSIPLAAPVPLAAAQAHFATRYTGSAFVRVLDPGDLPETRHVRGSNRCDMALRLAAGGTVLLVFAAIDNLLKGAAGQAIQNWNRISGWPETTGLPVAGWSCA
jgi:N-acetyl-gamma-glutamyl-phosphate reductase